MKVGTKKTIGWILISIGIAMIGVGVWLYISSPFHKISVLANENGGVIEYEDFLSLQSQDAMSEPDLSGAQIVTIEFPIVAGVCAGVGLVLIIVGIVMVVASGKNKENREEVQYPQQPEQQETPSQFQPQETPQIHFTGVLVGYSGIYAGQLFPMTSGKLILGRDPSMCNILFPEETPGISANHCEIWYDALKNCFFLQDNGSKFGTYLENGVQLPPNFVQKLNPGEVFYLARKDTSFSVRSE